MRNFRKKVAKWIYPEAFDDGFYISPSEDYLKLIDLILQDPKLFPK